MSRGADLLTGGLMILTAALFFSITSVVSATPLFSLQAGAGCDTCHEKPDPKNPKWNEDSYSLADRKCRLSCSVCHVDPSGGKLRNNTGLTYFSSELRGGWRDESAHEHDGHSHEHGEGHAIPSLPSFLSIGGDFRFMFLHKENADGYPVFFPMQADLYISAKLHKHATLFVQTGSARAGNSAVREAFAIFGDFPFNAYLKAGKFIPPYGHRLEDHTAFVRTDIAFDHSQPSTYVSGVEAGLEPVVLFAQAASFTNDTTPAGTSSDTMRGYSAIAGWRGLWLHLGGSILRLENYGPNTARTAYGVFGGVRAWRLAFLFEWDKRIDTTNQSGGGQQETKADISFTEANFTACRGVNLKARYELFEPDKLTGENRRTRNLVGIDYHPVDHVELSAQYRFETEDQMDDVKRWLLMAHLWF